MFQFNFVGRVLGPRGMTLQEVESTTGCELKVRGKGSIKIKKLVSFNKAKLNLSLNKFVKPILGSTISDVWIFQRHFYMLLPCSVSLDHLALDSYSGESVHPTHHYFKVLILQLPRAGASWGPFGPGVISIALTVF